MRHLATEGFATLCTPNGDVRGWDDEATFADGPHEVTCQSCVARDPRSRPYEPQDPEDPYYEPVYRDGKVHVASEKCKSCIFRSVNDGRIKGLQPGRVSGMVVEARANESVIPCHNTIHDGKGTPAICRGYWDLPVRPAILDLAERMNVIEWQEVPA